MKLYRLAFALVLAACSFAFAARPAVAVTCVQVCGQDYKACKANCLPNDGECLVLCFDLYVDCVEHCG